MVAEADPCGRLERATPAATDDNLLPFAFPAVERKKVTAAFDGGRLSSDGGVMLLSQAERRLGLAERLAAVIPDERDASRVIHRLPDILRARIFAIACGYEDADDLDRLRSDPTFKLACGRLPDNLPGTLRDKLFGRSRLLPPSHPVGAYRPPPPATGNPAEIRRRITRIWFPFRASNLAEFFDLMVVLRFVDDGSTDATSAGSRDA